MKCRYRTIRAMTYQEARKMIPDSYVISTVFFVNDSRMRDWVFTL